MSKEGLTKEQYIKTAGAYLKTSKHYTSIYKWVKPHKLKEMDHDVISKVLDPLTLVSIMGVMSDSGIYHGKILPDLTVICRYFNERKLTFDKGILKIRKMSDKQALKAFGIMVVYRAQLLAKRYNEKDRIIQDITTHDD